jgi:hypothetical protein
VSYLGEGVGPDDRWRTMEGGSEVSGQRSEIRGQMTDGRRRDTRNRNAEAFCYGMSGITIKSTFTSTIAVSIAIGGL